MLEYFYHKSRRRQRKAPRNMGGEKYPLAGTSRKRFDDLVLTKNHFWRNSSTFFVMLVTAFSPTHATGMYALALAGSERKETHPNTSPAAVVPEGEEVAEEIHRGVDADVRLVEVGEDGAYYNVFFSPLCCLPWFFSARFCTLDLSLIFNHSIYKFYH